MARTILEDYEAGYLEPRQQLERFAQLIRMDKAWILPELYIRTARRLIDVGYITPRGQITDAGYEAANVEALGEHYNEGREGSPCDVNVFNDPLVVASWPCPTSTLENSLSASGRVSLPLLAASSQLPYPPIHLVGRLMSGTRP